MRRVLSDKLEGLDDAEKLLERACTGIDEGQHPGVICLIGAADSNKSWDHKTDGTTRRIKNVRPWMLLLDC